jgi:starvation-inducible DNA-binding protein
MYPTKNDLPETVRATVARPCERPLPGTSDLGDADTADVFTEISRGTDKWLWMVEAHVTTER